MGLFSSISKAVSGVGGLLNGITGASNSAKTQYNYQTKLNNQSYAQQKYFGENAHQMEVQDLMKAGLNPALSAGGATAGNIATSGRQTGTATGSVGQSIGGTIGAITNIMEMNSREKTNSAQRAKINADTNLTNLQAIEQALKNESLPEQMKYQLERTASEIRLNLAHSAKANSEIALNQQTLEENTPIISENDITDLENTLNDKKISGVDKAKIIAKTLGKAYLLGKNRGRF